MSLSRRILLVEDETTLRLSMARGLVKLTGVDVAEAGTVREAKEALRVAPPDLVFSDLDLPDGSGIEVAVELERLGLRVPVVFVSAYVGKYRSKLPTRGDVDVYEKPLALDKLRALAEDKLGIGGDPPPISPFGVADYVQLASMGRHSVVIEVRCAGGGGRIVIKAGEAWSAQDRLGSGIDAFRRLAFLAAAQVTCRTLGKNELPPRNISGSAEHMLLDVARQLDEGAHHDDASASASEVVDDGWGDVFKESVPPRRTTRPPRAPSQRPPQKPMTLRPPRGAGQSIRTSGFEDLFESGVDALLAKDYSRAYSAFLRAKELAPEDRKVLANLARLREMGFT
jgi:CheY-like chemotaxis protein